MEWVKGSAIGRGSFGVVNIAKPKNNSEEFPSLMAVKTSKVSDSASLQNEKLVLDQLQDSPHVIKCLGDEIEERNGKKNYNLFLEYASGGSLADKVKVSGRLPESDVRRYARSILKGLYYIHEKGFVHCDIKLQNILLFSDGQNDVVKIADFGLATRRRETSACQMRGTPLYMSPEILCGREQESASDIWAFGCAVAEMVAGRPPWKWSPESDVCSLLLKIGLGEVLPEIPYDLSSDGKDFLVKCFSKDPAKRWTAKMLLTHPFAAVDLFDQNDTVSSVGQNGDDQARVSPRSLFDFPESISNSTETTPSHCTFSLSEFSPESDVSPAERLRQLAGEEPTWSSSGGWETIRSVEWFSADGLQEKLESMEFW
ncbi:Protein kinase domain [Dillenia turbinata]|uniref:Protein kinase domain n=1 Tax=Dillenia turbinata TaxID=194707 RepID=A0AAN8V5E3_9MAGN